MTIIESTAVLAVRRWVDSLVVGLNLCPFAKTELINERVRFVECPAQSEVALLDALTIELELLETTPALETTLLVHPNVLHDFADYNQFLNEVDALLVGLQFEGVFQVASFHPDYQFGGTAIDAAENYTNRSPYPLLHILREASLERVIAAHPDTAEIPQRNVELMNSMGSAALRAMLARLL